ncbi:hypothetical protein FKL49_00080 [Klebsiella quasipneumoniae]|nr:hypothetical protein [Klebsiella quasipneumoniae]MBZ7538664.1 hypothetical protein [Klebsiella quasipneumoniae]TNJ92127.1 hypothetical protein CI663_008395 [Klebsiella quasipneumoniae subsp. similipneumoniae]
MNSPYHPPVTHNDPDTISAKGIQRPEREFAARAAFCLLFHLILLRDKSYYCHPKRDTHHIIPPTCATGSSFILVFCTYLSLMLPMEIPKGLFFITYPQD